MRDIPHPGARRAVLSGRQNRARLDFGHDPGVLLNLAEHLAREPGPLLFLSVERFSGFTLRSDFRTELRSAGASAEG